ncbi:MAG: hypothetical protein ABI579_00855, partial [Candidatus Sumerlaeota bacterium]
MIPDLPARGFWSRIDFAIVVVLLLVTVIGSISYESGTLAWAYIIVMTGAPFWLIIRTAGTINRAANLEMREQYALTPLPPKWFVDHTISRAMWRANNMIG